MASTPTTTQKAAPAAPQKNGLGAKKAPAPAPAAPVDPYQRFRSLDEATWNRILAYSKEAERDIDDIVAEIQETCEEDFLKQYSEEQRPLWALRIVASRITVEGLTTADNYLLLVLDAEAPRAIQTKNGPKNIATVRGIAAKYDEKGEPGDASFAEVAFWEEAADKVNDAKVNEAYEIKLAGNYKDGRFQLKATPKTNWNKKTELDVKPLDLLKELYQKLDLADITEAAKQKKPVLVCGQVTFSRTGKGPKGNAYGIVTIYDETQRTDERGISVFTTPQNAVHGTGSRLWILGTVAPGKKNPETGEAYAPSINALAIIPEFSIPVSFSKQTTIEAAKIKDDDEPQAVDFTTFKKPAAKSAEQEESPQNEEDSTPSEPNDQDEGDRGEE